MAAGAEILKRPRWDARLTPLLALAAALPLLLPAYQALVDVPAHLAQFRIQQAGADSPLARYFAFHWRLIPNLAAEVPAALLAQILSRETSVRLVVALTPALFVLGALRTARAAHGTVPATAFLALPLAYSYSFNFGFLNSSLTTAVALVAFAPWLRLSREGRWRARSLWFLPVAAVLLLGHMIGYGTFGLLAGGSVIGLGLERGDPIPSAFRRAILACLPLLWPVPLLLAGPPAADGVYGWFDVRGFAMWAVAILRDGNVWLDGASTAVLYAAMALPLIARSRFAYAPSLLVPALLLWAAALILPGSVMGTTFASARLVPTAALMTILSVRPRAPLGAVFSGAAIAFFAFRLAVNAHTLAQASDAMARELPALDHIAPGARVAAFEMQPCRKTWALGRTRYVASYAIVRRDAFVNASFAANTGQLIAVRGQAYPALARLPEASVLPDLSCGRVWPFTTLAEGLARIDWHAIDNLWLIGVPPALRPRDPRLRPLWSNGGSVLYGVRR